MGNTNPEKKISVADNKNIRVMKYPIKLYDDYDNAIIVDATRVKDSVNRIIYIKLASENKPRKIWYINPKKRWLVVLRKKSRHFHRLSKSYGFNFEILDKAQQFDKILLRENMGTKSAKTYEIPVKVILEEGEFLFFKEQGFEKQIFLKLKRIKDFERDNAF